MAKRKPAQDETQELPPVTVETIEAKPLKTIETVEIRPGGTITVGVSPTMPADSEICYLYNDDTGELRQVVTRQGYAPAPMPFGFRLARNEEVPGK